jgi:transcriptional regulator with XRE-family HTH domain
MKKSSSPIANHALRQARQERGWTQRRLAELLAAEEQSVSNWERGTRFPSLEMQARLCKVFEKTPQELGLQPERSPSTSDSASPHLLTKEEKNRERMLKRVRLTWIEGVLEHSLHQAALIALGLQEQPDALDNPWHLTVQETNLPPRPLPPGTSIVEVYDQADGELLILGEPGGGKTTLLLELTRILLERADQDKTAPIPVVFHLSSWATKQLSLTEWLLEELITKYRVPRLVAQKWMTTDQLHLLLDGLDEVISARRSACVEAINVYRQEHPHVPVVVCSRTTEYLEQTKRMILNIAVIVQSLTSDQIDDYLSSVGRPLEKIRKALEEDVDLQEMVKSPLMLSILTLTYQSQGKTSEDFALTGSLEARRRQVFEQYTQRMLARRAQTSYPERQTIRWLAFLARLMQQQHLTEVYLERIQPHWLLHSSLYERYRSMALRTISSIEVMVAAILFAWVRGGTVGNTFGVGAGLFGELGAGKGNTIFTWMSLGMGGGVEAGGSLGILFGLTIPLLPLLMSATTFPVLSWKAGWYGLRQGLKQGLITTGIISFLCVPIFSVLGRNIVHGLNYGIGAGLFTGLLVGLLSGLLAGLRYGDAQTTQELGQRRSFRTRLTDGVIIGFSGGLSFALVDILLRIAIRSALLYGFIAGGYFCIAFGFAGGSSLIADLDTITPAEAVSWSWATVRSTLPATMRKGLVVALWITLSVGATIAFTSGVSYGFGYGIRYGLIFGLIVGLIIGMTGVLASLLHSGWSSDLLDANQLWRPNQGIRRSLWNAVLAGVVFALVSGTMSGIVCALAFGLVGGLAGWQIISVGLALEFGLLIGSLFALTHGGTAWIKHYLLRWQLWRVGAMPANYVAFLDDAASRILLRKVGGGYMFPHRILLDYFASLPWSEDGEDTSSLTTRF